MRTKRSSGRDRPAFPERSRRPVLPFLPFLAGFFAASLAAITAGQVINEFRIPTAASAPFGIAAGPDGNLWFTERYADRIGRIAPGGVVVHEFPVPTPESQPREITAGPDGNLWFVEEIGNQIGRITAAGVITEFPLPTAAAGPAGIVAGPDGNLWFTERDANQIGRITTRGVITEFPLPGAPGGPRDITVGSDGNLWFAERKENRIGRITTAGAITEFAVPTSNSFPRGIAAGPDGNLWFTEEGANQIGRITTAGVITEFPAGGGPFGIATGPDGNLWFTEQGSGRIARITTAGVITGFVIPGWNNLPRGIAAGRDGNLWFVERGSNEIGRITTGPLSDLGLTVDAAGNGVFEPGETVTVAPTWKNNGASTIAPAGVASAFTGPVGPTYVLADSTAGYGSIAAGSDATCETPAADCYSLGITASSRPVLHWDAAFHERMSDGTEKIWTLHIGDSFTDVPSSSTFYRSIETVFHNGVTVGCGGTDYCPDEEVTRQQMAVFLLVSRFGSSYVAPACTAPTFGDVPCSSEFARWVNDLASRGMTTGCSGGNYYPTDPVTRAQMAVFLLRTKEGPTYAPPACTAPMFADVPCSSGSASWINELASRGIADGCGGGNYCPDAASTRGEMAALLATTFGLQLHAPSISAGEDRGGLEERSPILRTTGRTKRPVLVNMRSGGGGGS